MKAQLYKKMMRDVLDTMGSFPSGSIKPELEYEVMQRMKNLWKKSRRYAMRSKNEEAKD